jgi:8-oxo-dGTP diphosphatase
MIEATLIFLYRGHPPEDVLLGYKKDGFGQGKLLGFGGKVEPGETTAEAAIREMEEETSIKISPGELSYAGELLFQFPHNPEWDQTVYVYLSGEWSGEPQESQEMMPVWININRIPYDQMWDDGAYWLPRILAGEKLKAKFTFMADNATVDTATITTLENV